MCKEPIKVKFVGLICLAIDEFESSATCVVHISVCGFGAVPPVGESTLQCPAGFCHQCPSCGRSSPSCSLLLVVATKRLPWWEAWSVTAAGADSPLLAQWGPWQAGSYSWHLPFSLLVIKLSCFSIVCLDL